MTDQVRQRFASAVIDKLVGHTTILRWYDDKADAQAAIDRLNAQGEQAVIVTADGCLGWGSDHDVRAAHD
jgi:hypothetical protein